MLTLRLMVECQPFLRSSRSHHLVARTITVAGVWKSDFVYDALGRRRIRREYTWSDASLWLQTNEVRYLYEGYLPIQERDGNNYTQVTYTQGVDLSGGFEGAGGIGGLLARSDSTSTVFYHADASGSVSALVNGSQAVVAKYAYDPYGNVVSKSGPVADVNSYRFSSKEAHGNSGLYAYGFRHYEPAYQRWLNRDPLEEDGGINLYAIVENNPVNRIDPLGLQSTDSVSSNLGRSGGVAEEYLLEVRAAQLARERANQYAKKMLKEVMDKTKELNKHLDKKHLEACKKELGGDVVKRKPSGKPYDHVDEVRNAFQGVKNQIDKLKEALNRNPGYDQTQVVKKELKKLQTLHDRAQSALQAK